MDDAVVEQARAVFMHVLRHLPPAEWDTYVRAACTGNEELLHLVRDLLQAHQNAGNLLAQPATLGPATADLVAQQSNPMPGPAPAEAAGDWIAGRYKLLELIGEGGMGAVWMAEQREPVKRLVAVKLIKPGMDSKVVLARFEAERQALALMDHPNIAKVHDGGTTDSPAASGLREKGPGARGSGRPFFVMELVRGLPLTTYCDDCRLSVRQRLDLFVQVCSAVQHAHQKGVIHRDLKPSNILVADHDGKPVPKVIDFGLAKALGPVGALTDLSLHTACGTVLGTPLYMAPEQVGVNALDVDTRADIYALGVILYELLTGTTPLEKQRFKEAAWEVVQRLIREEEPPPPSVRLSASDVLPSLAARRRTEPTKLAKLVRGDLDWIVLKALEKDRSRRYETANALAMDVQRFLADEAVLASPPSVSYRLRKFARKHRAGLTVAASFLLLLATATALTAWQAVEATRAKEKAVQAAEAKELARLAEAAQRARTAEAEKVASNRLAEVLKEKERADTEAKITQAVNGFLQDLLAQADVANQEIGPRGPAGADRDPDIKVRELLDRAAHRIEGEFAGQPLTEAAIRLTIGQTYLALGRYADAERHLQRAYDLRRALLGSDRAETLASKYQLGRLYWSRGDRARGEALLQEVLQAQEKYLPPDHPDTLRSKATQSVRYEAQGRTNEARVLAEEVLAKRTARLGPDHPETLQSGHDLAFMRLVEGKYDQAETLFRKTLQKAVKALGASHPLVLECKDQLGFVYLQQGKFHRAEVLYEELHRESVLRLGADDQGTLLFGTHLVHAYNQQHKYALAEALGSKVVAGLTAKLGADHPLTLHAQHMLASSYKGQGKYEQAEALYHALIRAQTAELGADHRNTLVSKFNLSDCYARQRKYAQAEALDRELVPKFTAKLGADHPFTLIAKAGLASSYYALGKYDLAEAVYKEVLPVQTAKAGADHRTTLIMTTRLGQLYLAQKRWADAERVLRDARARWRRVAPEDDYASLAQAWLGAALLGQRRYAEAEPEVRAGYQGLKQHPAADRQYIAEALERLVALYDAWGKKDEAARWRQEQAQQKAAAEKTGALR